jgi:uncharacterized repeat protein (TIGR01451 family)
MRKHRLHSRLLVISLALIGTLVLSHAAVFGQATITIVNTNAPGVGFNDPTPVAPVGGNTGTTLGQQRLIAFQFAANIWGSKLTSNVEIKVDAAFEPLFCTDTTGVLGQARSNSMFANFSSAPPFPGPVAPNTWHHSALADKRAGVDLDPGQPDIVARFNVNLGLSGCLSGSGWYYGLDGNHGSQFDLVTVLLHELAHGLGFSQFASLDTGAQPANMTDVYARRLLDTTTGKTWDVMTDAERAASSINVRKLVWTGPTVTTEIPGILIPGVPRLRINSPAGIAGDYSVGPANFGPSLSSPGITGNVVLALDAADAAGPLTTDACSPLTNAASVAGRIALVDRGTCNFTVKVKNAQDAGAIGVLVADNVAAAPPSGLGGTDATITIPSARIALADGNTIKANLGTGVNATLSLDLSTLAGADSIGRALMYTPNPLEPGSSVSHWDTIAFRNQLMEPAINADLTHSVMSPEDLTLALLKDVGWFVDVAPSADLAITKTDSPDPVAAGANLTYTINVSNNGPSSATSAQWQDTLPAGTRLQSFTGVAGWGCSTPAIGSGGSITCNKATVASGESASFTAVVRVDASVADGATLSNTATVSSSVSDPNTANNSATTTTSVTNSPVADLAITKTDSPDPVAAGANLTYTIKVSNNGPSSATSAQWQDTLPAGTRLQSFTGVAGWGCSTPAIGSGGGITCNKATVASGESASFTVVVRVDASVADGATLSNTATVSSSVSDPNVANNSATTTTSVVKPANLADLEIISVTDTPDPAPTNAPLTYTIKLRNNGPSAATGVELSDMLPSGARFNNCSATGGGVCGGAGQNRTVKFATLAAGASATVTIETTVSCAVAAGAVISNTAVITATTTDPNPGNNSASTTTVASASPPTITLKAPISLWSPNHKYQTVTIAQMVASVSGDCSVSVADVVIEKVTSDEPDNAHGDGNTTRDIVIAPNCRLVQLRAERDGSRNGRVYTITLRLRDGAGNVTRKDFEVRVPISQNGVPAVKNAPALTVTCNCP